MAVLQARILEWVAMLSSSGSSQPRDQTQISCIAGRFFFFFFFYHLNHRGPLKSAEGWNLPQRCWFIWSGCGWVFSFPGVSDAQPRLRAQLWAILTPASRFSSPQMISSSRISAPVNLRLASITSHRPVMFSVDFSFPTDYEFFEDWGCVMASASFCPVHLGVQ